MSKSNRSSEERRPIPSDARVSAESTRRFWGGHPRNGLGRFSGDDTRPPIDLPPIKPPTDPPPPEVIVPDLAFQFRPCLTDEQRQRVLELIRDGIRRGFQQHDIPADPEVRGRCVDGIDYIAAWQWRAGTEAVDAAREEGTVRIDLLEEGEGFGSFINTSLIRRIVDIRWAEQDKTLNSSGTAPEPGGPLHLTGLKLEFNAPDEVLTRVSGYHEDPWPDVDFELTIKDTLGVDAGSPSVVTETDLDVDKSWFHYLQLGFAYLFYFFIDAAFIAIKSEDFEIPSEPSVPAPGGAGALGAALMIRDEIMIDKGLKVALVYRRFTVSAGGFFGGGIFFVLPREPVVQIAGPVHITVDDDTGSTSPVYTALTADLRGNLQISWTSDGAVTAPNAQQTHVTFNTAGASDGTVLVGQVSVSVRDADGLTAQASTTVRIYVRDILDETVPDPCRAKPWLPGCNDRFEEQPVPGEGPHL